MHRLTRPLLNSPVSTRLPTAIPARPRLVSSTTSTSLASRRRFPIRATIRSSRCKITMDPIHPLIDPDAPEGEDFVHVDDPNPAESLSASFEDVRNEEASAADEEAAQGAVEEVPPNDAVEGSDEIGRRDLPEELMKNVVRLTCESMAEGGVCDVYLVGTAHVSQESCREVKAIVSFLKPQVVFVELCSSRIAILSPQNIKIPTTAEMFDMWKKKHNLFAILYNWILAKVASKVEVFPGSEFRIAYEEAIKYGGKVILGDRPVQITIRRTWEKMPLWHKTKFVFSLLCEATFVPSAEEINKMLKELDDHDALTLVVQEMSKMFPTLIETLVHERDRYMSCKLLGVAKEHSSVVAVVGRGHRQGIKKNWGQPVSLEELLELPSQKQGVSVVKILTSLGVAVAGVAIISGLYLSCKK